MPITWHDREMQEELNLWAAFRSTSGHFLTMHLFTDPSPPIGDDFDCTTLTEPTFPGYAPVQITLWDAAIEDEGGLRWISNANPSPVFCRTTAGATVLVHGVFFTREEDGACVGAGLIWPDGIAFTTECDCWTIPASKTEQDQFPGVG